MWWPGLSLIWCAGTQRISPLVLAGLATGLLMLDVIDVITQPTSSSSRQASSRPLANSTATQPNGGAGTGPVAEPSALVQYVPAYHW